jgi:AcrR family transcriptional regulator
VSLDQVASLAKVARSTIYVVFGSKAGLFDAFTDYLWARTGMADLTRAVAHPDAREHLRGGIAAASAMYAAERDIYRVLHSMAQLDPSSVGGAVEKMDRERAGGMLHLARRLREQDVLRPDLTIEDAADRLWVLCSFESFDALFTTRGLSLERTVEVLVDTAARALYH